MPPPQITTRAWLGSGSGWESPADARHRGEVQKPLAAGLKPGRGSSSSLGSRAGGRALELRTQLHITARSVDAHKQAAAKACTTD